MDKNGFNPSLIGEFLGAVSIAASIVTSPVTRPWYPIRLKHNYC